jgi:hypothetical protein
MKKLLLSIFLSCAILSQSSFAMNDDNQKNAERKIIKSFQNIQTDMQTIQSERKGGPATQTHMAILMTNQVVINALPEGKKKDFLHNQNQFLLKTIIGINFNKQVQRRS